MRVDAKGRWALGVATLMALPATGARAADLDKALAETVRPFLESYCFECHAGEKPKGELDLRGYQSLQAVSADARRWATVLERLSENEMPPKKAKQPPAEARRKVIAWIQAVRREELRKNAGDPGPVLARRLSNAEYNYTIRDLTGVDLQPTREFPVDPTNQAGFDNSGESLVMSPALMNKYLQAARSVANHLVLAPDGIAFAPHPVLVDTDRDKYCVQRIVDFYQRQPTDYAEYFLAAWRLQHRAALGTPRATLAAVGAESKLSPQYLSMIWESLQKREEVGPLAKLQAQFRALPAPARGQAELARPGCVQMRDFVVTLRKKLEPRFTPPMAKGLRGTAQPLLMWRNREYATHRRSFDPAVLQVEGEKAPEREAPPKVVASAAADEEDEPAPPPRKQSADDDLKVPAGQRARYEAAFGRFASVFPDTFYVSERGRNYLDKSKDKGRLLSAGFHNLMGYFRDDQPLYDLVLDRRGKAELDELWREMDFVADTTARTFIQFYLSESGLARGREKSGGAPITSDETIQKVLASYRGRADGSDVAKKAVEDHFRIVSADIRWAERARVEAEPLHLKALLDLAARAYRRPLTTRERDDLGGYYRSLRAETGLTHDEAMRDTLVAVLMSPDFCYRIDVVEPGSARALSDHALASRLSYFLWSSLPDAELLKHAAAGDLHRPAVLAAQARRMLKDPRARGLATEFGGNWLDFRRFEQHNAVDRERFPAFTNELRQAMFEEPVRFIEDVVKNDRPILDFLYARHTFVNPVLAKHYGMPIEKSSDWVRVEDARKYGRGGILPMAVFLTQNAPGLRTSPVKRGYWVVRRVLGEVIPPPPAVVPELPRDEAKTELPLREMLARHRQDPACAACHARFDGFGLAFEGYGPVGEVRTKDLAGRPVDATAAFPGGGEGVGLDGLLKQVKSRREKDFVDNLSRKLLGYALGRTLLMSDEATIEEMKRRLAGSGQRFGAMVEAIVQSPQFLTKRGRDVIAQEGNR
ncbi:MAG TPA: DUF1592 domain-containing protein [Polyangia bacterium]|nr:DUF1592 domain-containing protein [Polyangia bacterium]